MKVLIAAAGAAAALALCRLYEARKCARTVVMEMTRLDGTTCSAQDVCARLRSHGVVVIDSAVPPETMDRVQADLNQADGTFFGGKHSFAGNHTRRSAAKPIGESKTVQELAVNPLTLGGVEALLGPWCKKVCLGTCSELWRL